MDDTDWVAVFDEVAEDLAAIFREPLLEGNSLIEKNVADWVDFANCCAREVLQINPPAANPGQEDPSPRNKDPIFAALEEVAEATSILRFSIPHFDPPNHDDGTAENAAVGSSDPERRSVGVGRTPNSSRAHGVGVGRAQASIGVGPTPTALRNVGVGQTPESIREVRSVGVGQSARRGGPWVETQETGVGEGSVLTPERPRRFSEKWQVGGGAPKRDDNNNEVEGVDPPGLPELFTNAAAAAAEKERIRSPDAPAPDAPSAYFTPSRLSIGASPIRGGVRRADEGPSARNGSSPGSRGDFRSPKRACNAGGSPVDINMDVSTPRGEPISPEEDLQGSPMDKEELPMKKLCFNERSSISPMREAKKGPSWGSKKEQDELSPPDEMDTDVIFKSPKGQHECIHISPTRDFLLPPKGLQQPSTAGDSENRGRSGSEVFGLLGKDSNDGSVEQTQKESLQRTGDIGDMDVDSSDFAFTHSLSASEAIFASPLAFVPPPSGLPSLGFAAPAGQEKSAAKVHSSGLGQGNASRNDDEGIGSGKPSRVGLRTTKAPLSPHANDAGHPFSIENLDASVIRKARPSRIPTPPKQKPPVLHQDIHGAKAGRLPSGMAIPSSPRCGPKAGSGSKGKPHPVGSKGKAAGDLKGDQASAADAVAQFHSFLKQGAKKKEENLASGKHDVKVPALQRAAAAKQKQEEIAREREERKKMLRQDRTNSGMGRIKEGGVKRQAEAPALPPTSVKKHRKDLPVGPIQKPSSGTHQFKTATVKKPGSALRQGPAVGQKKEVKSFLDQNQKKVAAFGKGKLGVKGPQKTPQTSRAIPDAGTPEYELTPPSVTEKNLSEREQREYRKDKHVPSWAKNEMAIMNHFMGKQKRVDPDELFKTSRDIRTMDLFEVFGKPDLTIPGNIRKEQSWLKRTYSNGDWSDWED